MAYNPEKKSENLQRIAVLPQGFWSFVLQKHHQDGSEKKSVTNLNANWSRICKVELRTYNYM